MLLKKVQMPFEGFITEVRIPPSCPPTIMNDLGFRIEYYPPAMLPAALVPLCLFAPSQ
jgi:hypothetical protein